jgi:hypothetical protein
MNTVWMILLPLAQKVPEPEDVKAGWLGFSVFLALAAAVVLLWLSMRRHLKKVTFEEEPDPGPRPRSHPRSRSRRRGPA